MADAAAPTDPTTAPTVTGVVESVEEGLFVLKMPGSDYRLHLVPAEGLAPKVGQKLSGVIRAQAT